MQVGVARDAVELQLVRVGTPGAPHGRAVVCFHVRDVAAYHAASDWQGADITETLAERIFGLKDFRVRALDGNTLGFGEPIGSESAVDSVEIATYNF